jgi:hypothetical protein
MMMEIIIIIIIIIQRHYTSSTAHVECTNNGDTGTTGPTGTISKSLTQYLSNVPGWHEIKELQTTAILGTARYCRKCWCRCTVHGK